MDDLDDDFGELYSEVEVQPTSAINTIVNGVSQFPFDEVENGFENNCYSAPEVEGEEGEMSSDSEDELNIVLNDDDDDDDDGSDVDKTAFIVNDHESNAGWFEYKVNEETGLCKNEMEQNSSGGKTGNGGNLRFQNMRIQTPVASDSRANGYPGLASYSSKSVEHKSKDDGYTNYLNASSLASHSGHNFSLPRSRTILDVNIDSLKHKPWRHPGVDITDFFNFDFNECSWKQYCNHLDTLQHQMSDSRYLCRPSTHDKELKVGTEQEEFSHKVVPERISHSVQLQSGMISGRAIRVEECIIGRQPSTNKWGPLDRDSDVVIQIALQDDLKKDCLSSSKEAVDQTEVDYEDTLLDEAREILCLSSASEDELSSLEGDDEKPGSSAAESRRFYKQSPTSGSVSKHREIDPGNGQTMDDVDCQGKWTDAVPIGEEMDTLIKSAVSADRRLSDAAPSVLKSHLNQGDQSPHNVTRPSSHNQCDYGCDTYVDLRRSRTKSELSSSSFLPEKRDSVTYDCYLSDDSKKYGVKPKPRENPFCSSSRRALQPDLSCHGNEPSYIDDDASHLSSKEWFYDSRHSAIYQKHNGLVSDASKRNSYYKASNSFPANMDRYMKRPYWKGLSSEYDLDLNNRKNINGKTRHVEQRPMFNHKEGRQGLLFDEGRQGLLFDEGRHAPQYMESQPYDRIRQRQTKYDCYLENEGGNQRKTEKHDWQFRKDIGDEDCLVQSIYESSLTQGNYRKPVSSLVGIRDSVHHTGDKHISYSRREVESSGWSSGRCDQAFKDLDCMQYAEYDYEKGGCSRFWPHDSQDRPRSTCRQRLQGGSSPRDGMDQTHSRNMRSTSWAEKSYNNDHSGHYYFSDTDVKMRNVDNQDYFVRRKDHEQCGVSRWNGALYKSQSQQKDNKVLPSGPSYPKKRDQSCRSIDSQHDRKHFGKQLNHRKETRGRFRMTRGHKRGQLFRKSNVIRDGNYGNAPPLFRSSIDSHLVGVDRKCSGRSYGGSKMCDARNEYIYDNNCRKLKTFDDSNVDYPVKLLSVEHYESEDIEEGQILSEELNERAKEDINSSEDLREIGQNENLYYENAIDGNEALKGHENPRIQEILAKMERRRERFKRPIALKKDREKATPMAVDTEVETCNSNPQRPARKRRWDGTQHMLSPLARLSSA